MNVDTARLGEVRSDWTLDEVRGLFALPFADLVFHAQSVHRSNFDPNEVQVSTLLSIKTGACPEDCAYCPQSVRYDTGLEREELMAVQEVVARARAAREAGATRFCMGAAYRSPKDRELRVIMEMVRGVRELGLETCATLGMLTPAQAGALKEAGLDYYNHNLDTSAEFYDKIITTRSFQDRLDTLAAVREAGINVCSGGILGMGESEGDRAALLHTLATMPRHPESRSEMSDEMQALCFLAGANSIFYGERLLTTGNPDVERDQQLFARLGIRPESAPATSRSANGDEEMPGALLTGRACTRGKRSGA
jgi:biotin synthase